jgi:hypothetical protein
MKELRSFTIGPSSVTDQPDPALTVEGLVVPLLHGDVEHRAGPTPIVGRHAALVQFDVLDRVRVEHAEKAEEVAGIVHHRLVQQDQVLVRSSTTHIEPAVAFAIALHPGQVLDGLQDVHLAKERRQRVQLLHVHVEVAHIGAFGVGLALAHHLELLRQDGFGRQLNVQHQVPGQGDRPGIILITDEAGDEGVAASIEGQGIKAVGIRG